MIEQNTLIVIMSIFSLTLFGAIALIRCTNLEIDLSFGNYLSFFMRGNKSPLFQEETKVDYRLSGEDNSQLLD